jgi:hypothetical protein
VSQGAFDPDCVYLLGMVGPDGPYALILPENPSDVAFGFGAVPHDWGLAIRPTDGVMLFESSPDDQTVDSLFRFVRTADPWTGPAAPLAVQAVVPTSCPTGRLGPLTVFPDGALLYSCLVNGDVPYRVQATTPASATPFDAAGFRVMATGKDESFFGLGGDAGTTAAIIKGGDVIPITGVDAGFFPYLARSRPDGGFLVAATQAPVYLGLFAIDPDGSVQMLGEYDFSGITPGAGGPGTSLEASGAVIVIASTADWQGGAVRRITTNKPPEVIYDPMKGPVGTQTRLLVTGP